MTQPNRPERRPASSAAVGTAIVGLQFDATTADDVLAAAPGRLLRAIMEELPGNQITVGVLNRCPGPPELLAMHQTRPTVHLHLIVDAEGTPRLDGVDCAFAAMRCFDALTAALAGCQGGSALPVPSVPSALADDLRSSCAAWL